MDNTQLLGAIAAVSAQWARLCENGEMSAQTFSKFSLLLARFQRYAGQHGVERLDDVTDVIVGDFVFAYANDRRGRIGQPALATAHLRRSVLRMMFRTARELGLTDTDPTWRLVLPARTRADVRPLDEDEAAAIRRAAEFVERPSRHAAAAALALAGGHSGEIGHVAICDVDIAGRRAWMHGSTRTDPRWCPLDQWAMRVLTARIAHIGGHGAASHTAPLAVSKRSGSDEQIQARVCVALTDLLKAIGLGSKPDVKPASLTAYAAAAEFTRTGRIEAAALRLGLRSLDRAAAVVQHHWLTIEIGDTDA